MGVGVGVGVGAGTTVAVTGALILSGLSQAVTERVSVVASAGTGTVQAPPVAVTAAWRTALYVSTTLAPAAAVPLTLVAPA